jgi:hypothetical protein
VVNVVAADPIPDINLSSTTLAFGDVEVGSSATASVAIQNVGNTTLNITGISLAGTNTDFALTGTLPTSIAAGNQALVEVRYSPSATGLDTETLTVNSNDPDEASLTVAVSGNGIASTGSPDINLPSTVIAFGNVDVGSTARETLDIQNVGTDVLTVNSLGVTGSTDFVLSNPPATPFTIAAGRQVRVKVEYKPSAAGAASATVNIGSDSPGEATVSASLSGTGVAEVPDINLPSPLAFGDVEVGSSRSDTMVVQNVGTGDLTITGLSLTGGNTDFVLDTATPITIRPGREAKVQVTYSPSAVAGDADTLQFVSDDPDESPANNAVSGNGTASTAVPDINLPVASLDFGDTTVGTTQRGFVDIQNTGNADLSVTALAITGSLDFVLVNPPATPFTVKAGRQLRVKVEYTASVTGPASGSVDITSNDPNESPVAVPLSGNGIAGVPDINPSPTALVLGDVEIGQTVTGDVAIQNVGTGTLNISSISLAGTNADFALTGTLPTSIAPGHQAIVTVSYSPSAIGGATETLSIVSDDPDESPLVVAVSGNGLASTAVADINLPAGTIVFGDVEVGTTVTTKLAVQNVGTAALNISGLSLAGTNGDFALVSSAPIVINPGHQAWVEVSYSPSATGAGSETLTIVSDDPDESPLLVPVSGNGVAPAASPDIHLPSTSVAYGDVIVGKSKTATVAIQNMGTGDLNVTNLTVSGAGFALAAGSPTSFTVGSYREFKVDVVFSPGATGPASGSLVIDSNDTDEASLSVSLSGNGVAGVADINLPVTSYDFGDVVTDTTSSGYIAIQNPGTADLTVTGLTLSGSPFFTLVNAPTTPFVVKSGYQVTIRVDYHPTAEGPATGTLTITSDDPDIAEQSLTVDLLGNGVAPGA